MIPLLLLLLDELLDPDSDLVQRVNTSSTLRRNMCLVFSQTIAIRIQENFNIFVFTYKLDLERRWCLICDNKRP